VPRAQARKFSEPILRWAKKCLNLTSLRTDPPDPANFKFVWTSVAVMPPPNPAKGPSARATGHGAGVSSAESRAKAIGEALEIYAGNRCDQGELVYARAGDLRGEFLDPRQLCLYSRAQYRLARFPFESFQSGSRIAWTRGRWVDTGKAVWLPAFLTYFGADVSAQQSFAQVTNSGVASGMSVEDAAMRAVAELVERDSFMITWLAQKSAVRLIVDSALDRPARQIINRFEARGTRLRFYLLNTGIDVPVILCLGRGDGTNWLGATVGLGAHLDSVLALRKAILEQALIGPALWKEMLSGRRIPARARQIKTTLDHALYYAPKHRARAFDFLDTTGDVVCLSDLPQPKNISLRHYTERLRPAGVRVAIKDLTPPDIAAETPFRVVRALATRLQPIHFGYGLTREGNTRLRSFAKDGLNLRPHPLA